MDCTIARQVFRVQWQQRERRVVAASLQLDIQCRGTLTAMVKPAERLCGTLDRRGRQRVHDGMINSSRRHEQRRTHPGIVLMSHELSTRPSTNRPVARHRTVTSNMPKTYLRSQCLTPLQRLLDFLRADGSNKGGGSS